jgi:hypothetical protein
MEEPKSARSRHQLAQALEPLVQNEVLAKWFGEPNEAFGGLKPIEIIERGESDRLWQMVFELRSGAHV